MDEKHQSCWMRGLVSKKLWCRVPKEAKLENLLLKKWWRDHKID